MRYIYCMNIDIIFSWPKEYLNIVMGNGYGNPYTKEYFEYRDGENPHTSVRLNIWKIYVLAPRSPPKCAYPIKSLFSGSQLKMSPPFPRFRTLTRTQIYIYFSLLSVSNFVVSLRGSRTAERNFALLVFYLRILPPPMYVHG
jgi:hypothetical protein